MRVILTDEKKQELRQKSNLIYWQSDFCFLRAHNGLRPGKVHIFLGVTHTGKSTLMRSILCDYFKNNELGKIAIWLSEEDQEDFETDMSFTNDQLGWVDVKSEMENREQSQIYFMEWLREIKPSILMFDNITTSRFFPVKDLGKQESFAMDLKVECAKLKIPFIIFAHTDAKVTENHSRRIETTDMRGIKTVGNMAQFFYILQRFPSGSVVNPTIRITKHRGQKPEDSVFYLKFDSEKRIYTNDFPISWEKYNELFKGRNKF